MPGAETLAEYHLHETDWESYEQLRAEFEWSIPETFNMASYVCDRWAGNADRVALFVEETDGNTTTYTFRELRTAANRLANYLENSGIEKGDRVAINTPQRVETAVAHIAAWKVGAVSVPLSILFGPDALEYRLDDCEARVCLVDGSNVDVVREVRDDLDNLETVVTTEEVDSGDDEVDLSSVLDSHSLTYRTRDTAPDDDALIVYTSGTTGPPKGVVHTQDLLLGHLPVFLTVGNLQLDDSSRFWTPASWAWMAGLFDVLCPALFFGRPVLAYDGGQFDPAKAFELIDEYEVTFYFAPPTALRAMMHVPAEEFDVDNLRTIASGGESVGRRIVQWAEETFGGAALHEGYGQTEANYLLSECSTLDRSRDGSMGVPGPGHDVEVVDPETAEATVEPGEIGELAVRYEENPVCFEEYLNRPDATADKIRNGWLLTEDLAYKDEEGYLYFNSRKDDVIISAGYRIGPEEVEESLASHEAVADAGVVGVFDEKRGEVPAAFVVLVDDHTPSEELASTLQRHVKERLAKYEYPREITFLEQLPRTTTGKVRRAALRERDGLEQG